jgi:hypothetical protein
LAAAGGDSAAFFVRRGMDRTLSGQPEMFAAQAISPIRVSGHDWRKRRNRQKYSASIIHLINRRHRRHLP